MPSPLQIRNSTAEFLIFTEGEIDEISVTEDFSVTASDGKNYKFNHMGKKP